ncbi:hypothetical protein [Aureibacillus halotolerans]|nr:hypothetical protein [Aureibacillus halotolerans]
MVISEIDGTRASFNTKTDLSASVHVKWEVKPAWELNIIDASADYTNQQIVFTIKNISKLNMHGPTVYAILDGKKAVQKSGVSPIRAGDTQKIAFSPNKSATYTIRVFQRSDFPGEPSVTASVTYNHELAMLSATTNWSEAVFQALEEGRITMDQLERAKDTPSIIEAYLDGKLSKKWWDEWSKGSVLSEEIEALLSGALTEKQLQQWMDNALPAELRKQLQGVELSERMRQAIEAGKITSDQLKKFLSGELSEDEMFAPTPAEEALQTDEWLAQLVTRGYSEERLRSALANGTLTRSDIENFVNEITTKEEFEQKLPQVETPPPNVVLPGEGLPEQQLPDELPPGDDIPPAQLPPGEGTEQPPVTETPTEEAAQPPIDETDELPPTNNPPTAINEGEGTDSPPEEGDAEPVEVSPPVQEEQPVENADNSSDSATAPETKSPEEKSESTDSSDELSSDVKEPNDSSKESDQSDRSSASQSLKKTEAIKEEDTSAKVEDSEVAAD